MSHCFHCLALQVYKRSENVASLHHEDVSVLCLLISECFCQEREAAGPTDI